MHNPEYLVNQFNDMSLFMARDGFQAYWFWQDFHFYTQNQGKA